MSLLFFFSCRKKHVVPDHTLVPAHVIGQNIHFSIENSYFLPGSVPYLFSSNWTSTSELSHLTVEISNRSLQDQIHELTYTTNLDEFLQPNFDYAPITSSFFHGTRADVVFDPPLSFENVWESVLAYNVYMRSNTSSMIASIPILKKLEFSEVEVQQTGYRLNMQEIPEKGLILLDYQVSMPLDQLSTTDPYQIRAIVIDDTQNFSFLNEEVYIDQTGKLIKNGQIFQPKLYTFMFFGVKKITIRTYLMNKNPYIEAHKINRTIAVSDLEIRF